MRPSQRWTELAAQRSGWQIINEGLSGDTSGGILVRLHEMLRSGKLADRPQVLMMGGSNDIFFSGSDLCVRSILGAMLHTLLAVGIRPFVGIPLPVGAQKVPPAWKGAVDFEAASKTFMDYCDWLVHFCACFGADVIDFHADFLTADGAVRAELLSDGLHPTAEGHRIMAECLLRELVRHRLV